MFFKEEIIQASAVARMIFFKFVFRQQSAVCLRFDTRAHSCKLKRTRTRGKSKEDAQKK